MAMIDPKGYGLSTFRASMTHRILAGMRDQNTIDTIVSHCGDPRAGGHWSVSSRKGRRFLWSRGRNLKMVMPITF